MPPNLTLRPKRARLIKRSFANSYVFVVYAENCKSVVTCSITHVTELPRFIVRLEDDAHSCPESVRLGSRVSKIPERES